MREGHFELDKYFFLLVMEILPKDFPPASVVKLPTEICSQYFIRINNPVINNFLE